MKCKHVFKGRNCKFITLCTAACLYVSFMSGQNLPARNIKNRSQLVPDCYQEIALGKIQPRGWLQHQLQIMAKNSSGHLDEIYDKIKINNGWLGGKGDGWEETPYWLDGAAPLAYLLNDSSLKEKISRYVNWTLSNQRPSGYFGPFTDYERKTGNTVTAGNCEDGGDWWPKMIMLKVLQQYYSATRDKRVIPFMRRFFAFQLCVLQSCPLQKWSEWAAARGTENIQAVQWLFQKTRDPGLLKLCALLQTQSYPWSQWLGNRDWVMHAAAYQGDKDWMSRHGVNVAMGLKDPVLQYKLTGNPVFLKTLQRGFQDLMLLHGLPNGMFSADEDLHGNDPSQGTELCAIVETMYSLEQAIGLTGNPSYMDALERIAFNALPPQTSDDYNLKQYFQIANQMEVAKGVFQFSLPFDREMNNVFGMRSGYTCCLANMHQGWTKFASHLWYGTPDKGLAAVLYSPNAITTTVGVSNTKLRIEENTSYPFSDHIDFNFFSEHPVQFPLYLRIPGWCRQAKVRLNGVSLREVAGGRVIKIDRRWTSNDQLSLDLSMEITASIWGKNSRALERGPLVYALKLKEDWQKNTDEQQGDFFTLTTKDSWNFGLIDSFVKDPAKNASLRFAGMHDATFVWNVANAPIELKVWAKKIPGWKWFNNLAPTPVTARDGTYMGKVDDKREEVTLIPYGCTRLRVVAFPVVR